MLYLANELEFLKNSFVLKSSLYLILKPTQISQVQREAFNRHFIKLQNIDLLKLICFSFIFLHITFTQLLSSPVLFHLDRWQSQEAVTNETIHTYYMASSEQMLAAEVHEEQLWVWYLKIKFQCQFCFLFDCHWVGPSVASGHQSSVFKIKMMQGWYCYGEV